MTKTRSTKRALLTSGLVLIMCITMLIGTTFAWFTDSVTSGRNQIVAGNLDVELEYNGFGNDGFLRNIKYMGLGMLGIFVVIGIVMLITYVLNNATGKKKA